MTAQIAVQGHLAGASAGQCLRRILSGIDGNVKFPDDNEICVIVVEECSPHLFLFVLSSVAVIELFPLGKQRALDPSSQTSRIGGAPSSAIAVLVRICSGDNGNAKASNRECEGGSLFEDQLHMSS